LFSKLFQQDFIRINCGSHGKISESISDVSDVSAPNLKTDFIDLLKSWKVRNNYLHFDTNRTNPVIKFQDLAAFDLAIC